MSNKILDIANLVNDIYDKKITKKEANKRAILLCCKVDAVASDEALDLPNVMPRLICHYNEREGGYLTVGRTYQAIGKNEDGFEIIDDSGDCNTYSTAYLNEA